MAVSSSKSDADGERIVRECGYEATQAVALAKVLVDDEAVKVSPNPGASLDAARDHRGSPSSPKAIMCSLKMLAPALVPPTVTPWALRGANECRPTGVTAEQRCEPQLIAAREKYSRPTGSMRCSRPASGQSRRVSKSMTVTRFAPNSLKILSHNGGPGLVHAARRRDHHDVGASLLPDTLNEALQNMAIVLFVFGAANGHDPTALRTRGILPGH